MQETSLKGKDMKSHLWEKDIIRNTQKEIMYVQQSDKIDLIAKSVSRNNQVYSILITTLIHQKL